MEFVLKKKGRRGRKTRERKGREGGRERKWEHMYMIARMLTCDCVCARALTHMHTQWEEEEEQRVRKAGEAREGVMKAIKRACFWYLLIL